MYLEPASSFSTAMLGAATTTRVGTPNGVSEMLLAGLTRPSGCLARHRNCFGPTLQRRLISMQSIMERIGNALQSQEKPKIAPDVEAAAIKRAARRKENSLFERVQHHPVLSGKSEKERKRDLRKIDTRSHWQKPKELVRKVRDLVGTLEIRPLTFSVFSTCRLSSGQTRSKSLHES